jgi:hypothetical protein
MTTFRIHQGRLQARGAAPEAREHLVVVRDLWEERSAILEHDAGFTREEAETRALEELQPTMKQEAA